VSDGRAHVVVDGRRRSAPRIEPGHALIIAESVEAAMRFW